MTLPKLRRQTLVVLCVIGCLFTAKVTHAQGTSPKKDTVKPQAGSAKRPRTQANPRKGPAGRPGKSDKPYFIVYRLRHIKAEALLSVFNHMFATSDNKVASDLKNNSVLVLAPKKDHDEVQALLKKLDTLPEKEEQVKLFQLLHVKADEKLLALLRTAAGSAEKKDLSLAFDTTGNRVIARGTPVDLNVLEALLLRLDIPSELNRKTSSDAFTVRIVWLSTDKSLQKEPQILSRDLRTVVQTLEKAGVRSPRMVNQLMITTASNQDFAVSGKAKTGKKRWSISVEGELLIGAKVGEKGVVRRYSKPMIRITVTTNPAESKLQKGKPDLRTTIPAPLNSYSVLGMSPNAEGNNLFVIRVERKR